MNRLIIFTKYSKKGPSSKYRILIYTNDLSNDYDIKEFNFWPDIYYIKYSRNKKKYFLQIFILYFLCFFKRLFQSFFLVKKQDIIFIQKDFFPKSIFNPLNHFHRLNCKIIFDVDDAIWLQRKDYSDILAKKSDLVICGNDYLYEHYKKFNENICIIPTVDYTPMYEKYYNYTFATKEVVWIGSPSSIKNLDVIIKPFNQYVKRHKDTVFRIICSDDFGYCKKINNSIFTKWDEKNYIESMSNGTIGIMPLINDCFNNGKCGFKIIQYLNLKKPVIASNVGINSKIVDCYGYVVNSEDEWFKAFEILLNNQKEYDRFLKNIEKSFFNKYGYKKNYEMIKNVLYNIKSRGNL